MPEILTKHPEIVADILNRTKRVRCGKGDIPEILTQCPAHQFCVVPDIGEFCIYGEDQLSKMTQIKRTKICRRSCSLCGKKGHIRSNRKFHPL